MYILKKHVEIVGYKILLYIIQVFNIYYLLINTNKQWSLQWLFPLYTPPHPPLATWFLKTRRYCTRLNKSIVARDLRYTMLSSSCWVIKTHKHHYRHLYQSHNGENQSAWVTCCHLTNRSKIHHMYRHMRYARVSGKWVANVNLSACNNYINYANIFAWPVEKHNLPTCVKKELRTKMLWSWSVVGGGGAV